MKRWYQLKRSFLLLLTPISFLCLWLSKNNIRIAEEVFAKRIYKVYSQVFSFLTGWIPISVAELMIILLPIFLIVLLILCGYRILKDKRNRKNRIMLGVLNIACVVSVFTFMYIFGAGINYYRYSFAHYSNLEIMPSSEEELYKLTLSLAMQANGLRSEIDSVTKEGVYKLSLTTKEVGKEVKKAYEVLGDEYPILAGHYPTAKPVFFSEVLSRMEITGVFIPFTMEANVNVHVSDYSIAATMSHELAHLRGFMREDEANYIAYLTCMKSENIEVQYSGTMLALIHAGNALYRKNPTTYAKVREVYGEGVTKDLNANSIYWSQYENTQISKVADKVNDTYLKVNNQTDGVQSYGRMVDLLLAQFRKNVSNQSEK